MQLRCSAGVEDGTPCRPETQFAPASGGFCLDGSVIPATMVSGINSDLPGRILAQVSEDIVDTVRGRHLLIPVGSKLIGT